MILDHRVATPHKIMLPGRGKKAGIKNARVPWDVLVLNVMTLSVDLLRQIATDPHGFSRAHSIGNGLFNFPQGAMPFPRYASLRRRTLLVSAGRLASRLPKLSPPNSAVDHLHFCHSAADSVRSFQEERKQTSWSASLEAEATTSP